jgi:hypothetical protein
LRDVLLLQKGKVPKLNSGERVHSRMRIFDVRCEAEFPNREVSRSRMMLALKRILFADIGGRPRFKDCQRYFMCRANFRAEAWQVLSARGY